MEKSNVTYYVTYSQPLQESQQKDHNRVTGQAQPSFEGRYEGTQGKEILPEYRRPCLR